MRYKAKNACLEAKPPPPHTHTHNGGIMKLPGSRQVQYRNLCLLNNKPQISIYYIVLLIASMFCFNTVLCDLPWRHYIETGSHKTRGH